MALAPLCVTFVTFCDTNQSQNRRRAVGKCWENIRLLAWLYDLNPAMQCTNRHVFWFNDVTVGSVAVSTNDTSAIRLAFF
jgi:hypothetical protein